MFHQLSSLAAFGLTIVFVLGVVTSSGSPKCKTVTAAFYRHPYMNLIIDEEVFEIGDWNVANKYPVKDFGYDYPITAAFDAEDGEFYLISAHHQEGFHDKGIPAFYQIYGFSKVEETFKGEPGYKGVDAVATIDDDLLYYFVGCHYVAVDPFRPSQKVDKRPNSDLNLPCDVDAASYAPATGDVIVIKGSQAWSYNREEGKFHNGMSMLWLVPGVLELGLC